MTSPGFFFSLPETKYNDVRYWMVARHIVFYCACGMLLYWTDPSGSDPNVELCVIGRTVTINVITADDDTEREHIHELHEE